MSVEGLDALLVVGPENVAYATRTGIGPAHMWRRFGPYVALIPADPAHSSAAIVADSQRRAVEEAGVIDEVLSHPIWVEYMDVVDQPGDDVRQRVEVASQGRPTTRPERFDPRLIDPMIKQALESRGLERGRIGIDLDFLPASDLGRVQAIMPGAEIVDSTQVLRRLRVVKVDWEIERLRIAVKLTEHGIQAAIDAVEIGAPIATVSLNFKRGIIDAAERDGVTNLTGSWDILSVGDRPWSKPLHDKIQAGDVIKFDCGAIVDGYVADFGRTFSVGTPSHAAHAVHDALRAGMHAAIKTLRPGIKCSDVFRAAEEAVREFGFPSYTRGHFGHSIGNDIGQEEWPWLSATEEFILEPGMVLAVETPYYIDGVGGFMIEHNVVILDDGIEVLDTLPDELASIG